ncbi:uncharacterized protein C3orf38 homolog [Leptinotarsa decemlineata]|uniref:uncharacterized protein C3orf38 homolog n=1 Tax=Leptinotarsa decemlineata TaxID=7539 RepID=UPI000C2539F8|nr:uncharacterized protein C3orf38 homolog [Leptinotarsa decemlineata]
MTAENGIKELLSKLEEDDLLSLSRTVTQGLLKINSVDDAIKGILKYSPDLISILRRKIVTRDILFTYLDEKNVEVRLPITKNELIDKIADFWNISRTSRAVTEHNNTQTVCSQEDKGVLSANGQSQDPHTVSALAEQFIKWFYDLLNLQGIGSEHFFPEAKLKLNIFSGLNCDTSVIEDSPEEIANALFRIKVQNNLFFNPNISPDGVQGKMDPHGLVLILACGTLHTQGTCVGVFEQVFSLARDPYCENNWKIKNCELNLRSKSGVMSQPSLCDSELTSNLLSLPSSN